MAYESDFVDPAEVEETEVEETEDTEATNTGDAPVNEVVGFEEPADPEQSPFIEGDPHARLEAGLDEPDEEEVPSDEA